MSGTYKATGITLKSAPFGESDRLLTILTPEQGLVRAIAPGARKHQSRLRGRSGIFVLNQLLLTRGRSLDKILQADSLGSFPKLSQNLGKLTAGQYLAELALCQALSQQPQAELFSLLQEHLERLDACVPNATPAFLVHGIFHLLALDGIAPQVHTCCLTQQPLKPQLSNPDWRVGFAPSVGGAFHIEASPPPSPAAGDASSEEPSSSPRSMPKLYSRLTALPLLLLQQLSRASLLQPDGTLLPAIAAEVLGYSQAQVDTAIWLSLERTLRQYLQYHVDKTIHSASLIESCF
ncbi:MAG: DNA repair protein RecO [Cyanobacteria bacterium P01_A01_bin.135]